jgi:hypothetical protein
MFCYKPRLMTQGVLGSTLLTVDWISSQQCSGWVVVEVQALAPTAAKSGSSLADQVEREK